MIILGLWGVQDTVQQDSTQSIMFLQHSPATTLNKIEYRHQQGFFCDFEDEINKGRRINLNLGVGEQ